MAKVDLEIVAEVLKENDLDPATVDRIVRQLSRAAEKAAEEAAAERETPTKKQWVILLSDPRGTLPDEDLIGWVLQIPENESPAVAEERLVKAAHHFNSTRRGHKNPVKSVGEACEAVGGKFLKEAGVVVKTKLPVSALKTDNVLPPDEGATITLDDLRRR